MAKIKITNAVLERLKAPAAGQMDYFNSVYPALAVRVTPNGVKSLTYLRPRAWQAEARDARPLSGHDIGGSAAQGG